MYNPETEGQVVRETHRVEAAKKVKAAATALHQMRHVSAFVQKSLVQMLYTPEKHLSTWQFVAIQGIDHMLNEQIKQMQGMVIELTRAQQLLNDDKEDK